MQLLFKRSYVTGINLAGLLRACLSCFSHEIYILYFHNYNSEAEKVTIYNYLKVGGKLFVMKVTYVSVIYD